MDTSRRSGSQRFTLVTAFLALLALVAMALTIGAPRAEAAPGVANSEVEYLGSKGWSAIAPDGHVSWDVNGTINPGGPGMTTTLTMRGTSDSKQSGEVMFVVDDLADLTASTGNPSDLLVTVTFDGTPQAEQRIGDLYASAPALDGVATVRALGTGWEIADQNEHVLVVTVRLPYSTGNESQNAGFDLNARVTPLEPETETPTPTATETPTPTETETPAPTATETETPAPTETATATPIAPTSTSAAPTTDEGSTGLAQTGSDVAPWFTVIGLLMAGGICLLARTRRNAAGR